MTVYDLFLAFNSTSTFFFKVYNSIVDYINNNTFLEVALILIIAPPFVLLLIDFIFDLSFSFADGFDSFFMKRIAKKHSEHEKETRQEMKESINKESINKQNTIIDDDRELLKQNMITANANLKQRKDAYYRAQELSFAALEKYQKTKSKDDNQKSVEAMVLLNNAKNEYEQAQKASRIARTRYNDFNEVHGDE